MTFSFAFELSPQEHMAVADGRRPDSKRSSILELGWMAFAIPCAALGTARWVTDPPPSLLDVVMAIAGWLGIVSFVIPPVFSFVRRALFESLTAETQAIVKVDTRGVTEVIKPAKHEQWGWDEFRTVRSDKDGVVLEFRDGKSCWIPARAFNRANKRDEFVQFVEGMRPRPERVTVSDAERPVVAIPSGDWRWEVLPSAPGWSERTLSLIDARDKRNTMRISVAEGDEVSAETISGLIHCPSQRVFADDTGIEWRISFPHDGVSTAVPVQWPAGTAEPPRVMWLRPADDASTRSTAHDAGAADSVDAANSADSVVAPDTPDALPWSGLGHITHTELLQWFSAQRTRLPRSQTADAE